MTGGIVRRGDEERLWEDTGWARKGVLEENCPSGIMDSDSGL